MSRLERAGVAVKATKTSFRHGGCTLVRVSSPGRLQLEGRDAALLEGAGYLDRSVAAEREHHHRRRRADPDGPHGLARPVVDDELVQVHWVVWPCGLHNQLLLRVRRRVSTNVRP